MISYMYIEDSDYPHQIYITGKDINKLTYYAFGTDFKPEVKKWLAENIKNDIFTIDGGLTWFDIYFQNKDDALNFKITWS